MFKVETRVVTRQSLANQLRSRGIREPGLLLERTFDGYGDHDVSFSSLKEPAFTRFHEAADEVVDRSRADPSRPFLKQVLRIVVRGHSDFSWLGGGRNLVDESVVSATRAADVWRVLRTNIMSQLGGREPLDTVQVILEAVGAVEPLDPKAMVNPANRRVEVLLFDRFAPQSI